MVLSSSSPNSALHLLIKSFNSSYNARLIIVNASPIFIYSGQIENIQQKVLKGKSMASTLRV